jgi:flagellar biosynthesis/type III secretory pathway M-ring protein FliF/YscJ
VPYRTDDGGRALLVPADRLYGLRLSLASRGLPAGGGVGFELFDRGDLGLSEFTQKTTIGTDRLSLVRSMILRLNLSWTLSEKFPP